MSDNERAARQMDAFLSILFAAISDCATNRELTQIKCEAVSKSTNKTQVVRIILVPETMDMEWSKPLESK